MDINTAWQEDHDARISPYDEMNFEEINIESYKMGNVQQLFNVWPNPAKDILNLSFNASAAELIQWTIVKILGQVALHDQVYMTDGENRKEIDISALPEGSFMVQVTSGKEIYS